MRVGIGYLVDDQRGFPPELESRLLHILAEQHRKCRCPLRQCDLLLNGTIPLVHVSHLVVFTDAGLDSTEKFRLNGRKIPGEQREVYKTIGGAPHLDHGYTVFGEIVKGMDIVEKIAAVQTSRGNDRDRPLQDVRIIKAKLIKRKKHYK